MRTKRENDIECLKLHDNELLEEAIERMIINNGLKEETNTFVFLKQV